MDSCRRGRDRPTAITCLAPRYAYAGGRDEKASAVGDVQRNFKAEAEVDEGGRGPDHVVSPEVEQGQVGGNIGVNARAAASSIAAPTGFIPRACS